jgi:hypothetical protein
MAEIQTENYNIQNNEGQQYLKMTLMIKQYMDMKEINLKALVNIQTKY